MDGTTPALQTPRAAQALTLAALVLSLGVPLMPQVIYPLLISSFYLIAVLTLGLCREEIKSVFGRLARRSNEPPIIPKDFYVVMLMVAVEIAVPTYLLAAKPSEENLVVSFQIEEPSAHNVHVDYIFRNLGKDTALVQALALLEIAALSQTEDTLAFCDQVTPMTLMIVQSGAGFMGPGAQVGDASFRQSLYFPKEITVEGGPVNHKTPLEVDGTKTKTVSATFQLDPNHTKDTDTLVICPVISSLDVNNIAVAAVCRGAATQVSMGTFFNQKTSRSFQQFRLLPHSTKPTCPIAE